MWDQIDASREEARDLRTHGGELRRLGRVETMVGRRVLVQESRHVHLVCAVEAPGAVERPDLRAQAAHDEVLEDPRRRPHIRRRHRRSPASRVAGILGAAGWRLLSALYGLALRARVCGRWREGSVRRRGGGGLREEGDEASRVGWSV